MNFPQSVFYYQASWLQFQSLCAKLFKRYYDHTVQAEYDANWRRKQREDLILIAQLNKWCFCFQSHQRSSSLEDVTLRHAKKFNCSALWLYFCLGFFLQSFPLWLLLSGFISIQYILPLLLVSHHAHSCFRTLEENACNKFARVPEKNAGIICYLFLTSPHHEYLGSQIS